jgi:hypothetical protein
MVKPVDGSNDSINSEDIYNDLRQVTADLQHLSLFGGQLDLQVRFQYKTYLILVTWQCK